MKHRLLTMALPFAAGLALVGALAAGAGYVEAAIALVGAAVGFGLVALQLRLDDLGERTERRQSAHTAAMAGALSANAETQRRQTARLRRELHQARRSVDQAPSDTVALHRLLSRIAPAGVPLPVPGVSPASARSILTVAEEIRRADGPVTLVECGSGGATLIAALQLKALGSGRVFALESEPAAAERTRDLLREHGAEEFATVVDAPLAEVQLPDGSTSRWYDLSGLPDTDPVSILVVDGPRGEADGLTSYPAFPLLASRLSETALVVLDGTSRADERATVASWIQEQYDERGLSVVRTNGRAGILRARKVEPPPPEPVAPEPRRATSLRRDAGSSKRHVDRPEDEVAMPPLMASPGDEAPSVEPAAESDAESDVAADEPQVEPEDSSEGPLEELLHSGDDAPEQTVKRTARFFPPA